MKIHPFTFILTIIGVLLICLTPILSKAKKSAAMAKSICHMKNIGVAMTGFEDQYGHRPLPGTAIDFPIPYPQKNRNDANAILGQLIAAKTLESEKVFTLKTGMYSIDQADDNFSSASEILKAGECHFSYITCNNGTGEKPGSSAIPVVVSHLVPGTQQFDQEIFNGSATYLKLDSSSAVCKVNSKGEAIMKGQEKVGLLENGPDTIWGDWEPQIHHPLPFKASVTQLAFSYHPLSKILYPILGYLLFRLLLTTWRWKSAKKPNS